MHTVPQDIKFSFLNFHDSLMLCGVGYVGAVSSPCSWHFRKLCRDLSCWPSNNVVSIPFFLANSLTTCPALDPCTPCSLANFCLLIAGEAGGCCCRSVRTAPERSQVSLLGGGVFVVFEQPFSLVAFGPLVGQLWVLLLIGLCFLCPLLYARSFSMPFSSWF